MSAIERFTFFLDDQDNKPLSTARVRDGLPASDRIRAAMQLWQQGGHVAERINRRAGELRRDRAAGQRPAGSRQIKVSLVLGVTTHRALAQARIEDGIPASVRVRAAMQHWQQDPEFRDTVDALAAELRRQRFPPTAGTSGNEQAPAMTP